MKKVGNNNIDLLTNRNFSGNKWGIRILIFLVLYIGLYIIGINTFNLEFSAYGLTIITTICLLIASFLLIRFTRNMFRKKFLQYGLFFLVFLILNLYGTQNYSQAEKSYSTYIESNEFAEEVNRIKESIEAAEMPYSSYDEMLKYYMNNFPTLKFYAKELWLYQLFRDSCSIPALTYLILFIASGINYRRKSSQNKILQDDIDKEIEPTKNNSNKISELNQENAAHELICKNCDTLYPKEYVFCPSCGEELRPSICKYCHTSLEENYEFCPSCGKKIGMNVPNDNCGITITETEEIYGPNSSKFITFRRLLSYVFTVLWMINGLVLFAFWIGTLMDWLGGWGIIVGIFLAPGFIIFPVIYWIVEGVFPTFYFILLGVGIVFSILKSLVSPDN